MASLAAEGKDDGAGLATFVQSTENRVEDFKPDRGSEALGATFTGFTDNKMEDFVADFGATALGRAYAMQFDFVLQGETYRVLKLLQSGAHGSVFLARKISAEGALGESFAAKFFTQSDDEELEKLSKMSSHGALEPHPHVIGVKHYQAAAMGTRSQPGDKGFVLMELGDLGEPFNFMATPFPEAFVLRIFQHIIHGLEYLNSRGVVHCNIKPDNLVIDIYGNVRLKSGKA